MIELPAQDIPIAIETDSEVIEAWSYTGANETLTIVFKKGGDVWEYAGVPYDVANEMRNARSKGLYFLRNIKPEFKGALASKGAKKK